MNRIEKIETKCHGCGQIGVLFGSHVNPALAKKALEYKGWYIGDYLILCPRCNRQADERIIRAILEGEENEDVDDYQ
jgi:hypothetical protein